MKKEWNTNFFWAHLFEAYLHIVKMRKFLYEALTYISLYFTGYLLGEKNMGSTDLDYVTYYFMSGWLTDGITYLWRLS